jgi:dolichol-phosphate mannosyltransferase
MPGPAWIVLPTYCEADNLERMVRALRAAAPEGTRVLVVDDASPDGTGAIADRLAAADERVDVLHRPAREGLGPAYVAGFDRALAHGAGCVLEIDCDFSHDPAVVPVLIAAVRDGADLALGSRYVAGGRVESWSAARRAVSRAGCLYARAVLGVPVRDLTGGFKCFRAETLRAIDYRSARARGYAFQVELTYRALRAGLRVVELPIVFRERREGASKMGGPIALEAAWRVPALRLQSRRPSADPTV